MSWKEKLAKLKDLKNVFEGKEDIKQKLSFLFQPNDIRSASRFNALQCDFQTDVRTAKEFYPEFGPLEILAQHQGYVMISHKGLGRDEGIKASQRVERTPFGIYQAFQGKDGKQKEQKEEKK